MSYLSWYEILILLTIPALVIWVLIGHLTHTGVIVSVSETGFVLRSLVGIRRSVSWQDLDANAKEFKESLPRIAFRLKSGFLGWPSCIVLLRGRPGEREFTTTAREHFNVRQSRLETFTGRNRAG
jgi:hypothetical protein